MIQRKICQLFNSVPNKTFLDSSKLKALAENKFKIDKIMISPLISQRNYYFNKVENNVGNGEC